MDNTAGYSHRTGHFGNISSLALRSPPKTLFAPAQQARQPQHRPSIEKFTPSLPSPRPHIQNPIQTRESEGLIPVHEHEEEGATVLFIADCPSLHAVNGDEAAFLAAHRSRGSDVDLLEWDTFQICPSCPVKQGIFHKARRISLPPRNRQKDLLPPLHPTTQTQVLQTQAPPTPAPSPPTRHDRVPRSRHSIATAWLPHMSRSPSVNAPIPLHPEGPPVPVPPPSRSDGSSIRSKSSSAFSFSGFRRGVKMRPHSEVGGTKGSSLPSSLSFVFSAVGTSLLLWGKNASYVVRIEMATRRSELLRVVGVGGDEGVAVKCVAGGSERCLAVVSVRQKLFLASLSPSPSESLLQTPLQPLPPNLHPLCIAVSRDDRIAAVGLGPEIFLCEFGQGNQVWTNVLPVHGFANKDEVRFQALNFSVECSSLVASTQRRDVGVRTSEDDSVTTYVWEFQRDAMGYERLMSCKMPTDQFGLTSISYSPTLGLGLITGLTDSTYPLFLPPSSSSSHPTPHLGAKFSYKIRCAAEGPYPTHTLFFLNSKNQIFKADMSKRTVRLWTDLSKERKGMDVREEGAVLCCPDTGAEKVYAFWRVGEELRLVECVEGNGVVSKQNLKWLWDEVVLGV